MKAIMFILIVVLILSCFPKRYMPGPRGNIVYGEEPGYWKLIGYRKKGKMEDVNKSPDKLLLEVQYAIFEKDSITEPEHQKGAPYYIFTFFNDALHKTDSMEAVLYDARYDRKYNRSEYWYRINRDSGFAAYLDIESDEDIVTRRVEFTNIMKSDKYKPELDSLRYIYEPTPKFK